MKRGLFFIVCATGAMSAFAEPRSSGALLHEIQATLPNAVLEAVASRQGTLPPLMRRFERADGSMLVVLSSALEQMPSSEQSIEFDAVAQEAHSRFEELVPLQSADLARQGYRITNYHDGRTGLTLAFLERISVASAKAGAASTKSGGFCSNPPAEGPEPAYPVAESSQYSVTRTHYDAEGWEFVVTSSFTPRECSVPGCSPTGLFWEANVDCDGTGNNLNNPPTGGGSGSGSGSGSGGGGGGGGTIGWWWGGLTCGSSSVGGSTVVTCVPV